MVLMIILVIRLGLRLKMVMIVGVIVVALLASGLIHSAKLDLVIKWLSNEEVIDAFHITHAEYVS